MEAQVANLHRNKSDTKQVRRLERALTMLSDHNTASPTPRRMAGPSDLPPVSPGCTWQPSASPFVLRSDGPTPVCWLEATGLSTVSGRQRGQGTTFFLSLLLTGASQCLSVPVHILMS